MDQSSFGAGSKTNESLPGGIIDCFDARQVQAIVKEVKEHYSVAVAFLALESPHGLKLRARHGIKTTDVAAGSIAQHTIFRDLPIIIEDLQAHDRFANDILVKGPPAMNFFAGAPLMLTANRCVGTLCIMDTDSRRFSLRDAAKLAQSAKQVFEVYESGVRPDEYWNLTVSTLDSFHGTSGSDPENVADRQAATLESLPEDSCAEVTCESLTPETNGAARTFESLPTVIREAAASSFEDLPVEPAVTQNAEKNDPLSISARSRAPGIASESACCESESRVTQRS